MINAHDWLKHACRFIGAAGALAMLATIAPAASCHGEEETCSSSAFSAYAQLDDDDDDDDDDAEDDDEDDSQGFVYDEDEGSLMVDLENCAPGKYWMLDLEDGVPLPCR